MISIRLTVLLLIVLIIVPISACFAQGGYTQIDVPGAAGLTECYGIDNVGDVVGSYSDANNISHGFILSSGAFTTIDYPISQFGTQLYGLNSLGEVVGYAISNPVVGFVYDLGGQTFTVVSYPRASDTYPLAINEAGSIVGYITANNGNFTSGFQLKGSTYKMIKPRHTEHSVVQVHGLSAMSQIVGNTSFEGTTQNFRFSQGNFYLLPQPVNSAPDATVWGINNNGTSIVGVYEPTIGIQAGFLYENKVFTTVQFPGANYTIARAVNDVGTVVGYFMDGFGIHGFTWTATPSVSH